MRSPDGKLSVVFNGEIYNTPALRAELEAKGCVFRTTSDTEVLLHLYHLHGVAMAPKLRGMYAFAIWDEIRHGLFLARDPYGIKPLYYANDGWTFRFASQVKALLAARAVSRDPEPAGIVGFHLFGNVPEPFTLYREIRALPAGHSMWVDWRGPREPRQHSSVAAVLAHGALKMPSPEQLCVAVVRESLLDSVRHHLLSDVEVGAFLSGGVDSGALVGLMRDAGQGRIRTITLRFDEFHGEAEDEAPFAECVAAHYHTDHTTRRVSRREFLEDLPGILNAMDQPSIDGVNTYFVSKVARELGLKVAISGIGGDELFAGYPSFQDIPRWVRLTRIPAAVPLFGRSLRFLGGALMPNLAHKSPKMLGAVEYGGSYSRAYLLRRGLFLPWELQEHLDPDLVREGLRRLKPLERITLGLTPNPGSAVGCVAALEATNYMRNQLLRDADWAGMAHSLEIRVPLVDFELLRTMAPWCPSLRGRVGKRAMADAPSMPLPERLVNRPKTGFGVPTAWWLGEVTGDKSLSESTRGSRGLISRAWGLEVFARQTGSRFGVAGRNGRGVMAA